MDILEVFREFFENEKYKKCWHNYGFDRHVMANPPLNIHCRGFAGDTMHMARLWDSSRKLKGYSLESLSSDQQVGILFSRSPCKCTTNFESFSKFFQDPCGGNDRILASWLLSINMVYILHFWCYLSTAF